MRVTARGRACALASVARGLFPVFLSRNLVVTAARLREVAVVTSIPISGKDTEERSFADNHRVFAAVLSVFDPIVFIVSLIKRLLYFRESYLPRETSIGTSQIPVLLSLSLSLL